MYIVNYIDFNFIKLFVMPSFILTICYMFLLIDNLVYFNQIGLSATTLVSSVIA